MARISDIVPGAEFDPETDLKMFPAFFQDMPHCMPPWTPMFAWFWVTWLPHGMEYSAEKLSIPTHKGTTIRHFRGASMVAMNVIEDEEEIKRREVKFRQSLRPYIDDFDGVWNGYLDEMMAIYKPLTEFDLDAASNIELKEHFAATIDMYRRMWEIHWLMLDVVTSCYILFEDMCMELLGIDDGSPEWQKLMKGFDNKSFQTDKRVWEFSQDALRKGLADIFETSEAKDVVPKLERIEAGREWLKQFREFLWENGWRMQRMAEINEPTWIEDPTPAIINMQHFFRKGGGFKLDDERAEAAKEREEVAKALLQRVPPEHRDWFQTLMSVAQKAGSFNEEHVYYLDLYSHALIRHCCLGIGKRLVQAGAIDQVDDIFFLVPGEVNEAIITPEFRDLRYIVSKRRQDWEEWCRGTNPPMITREGVSPEEAMAYLLRSKHGAVIKIQAGRLPVPRSKLKADFYGVGGSPGAAEGAARCITSYEQLGEVREGEILVAPATTPSWTMVFGLVKGVIVASGGNLAHAAVVGREYGIPVVTNVFDGICRIK